MLEDGGERGGALVSDVVVFKTASNGNGERVGVSMGADTEKRMLRGSEGRFEPQAAYLSTRSVELPVIPLARAAPPSGPSLFSERLRAWERRCQRALTQ